MFAYASPIAGCCKHLDLSALGWQKTSNKQIKIIRHISLAFVMKPPIANKQQSSLNLNNCRVPTERRRELSHDMYTLTDPVSSASHSQLTVAITQF